MGSSFKGFDLFGSGAHRFVVGKQGRRLLSLATVSGLVTDSGTLEFGDRETRVEVRGGLVAASESALWVLRDAIVAQGVSTVDSGVLEDQYGHQWSTMKLLSFEPQGAVVHGRTVSLGYVAWFGVLLSG